MKLFKKEQNAYFTYLIAVVLPIVFGIAYSLHFILIGILVLCTVLLVPAFLNAQVKSKYEDRRLTDIDSYMQQFIQGMLAHKKVFSALKTAATVFEEGSMKELIVEAREMIVNAEDVSKSKADALKLIEEHYPCEQLKMIHDICLRGESNGADFTEELKLLDEMRIKWLKRTKIYKANLKRLFTNTVVIYLMMMVVCAFMLQILPEYVAIAGDMVCQIAAVVFYIVFLVFVLKIQEKTCVPLIAEDKHMRLKAVEEVRTYLANYKNSKYKNIFKKYGIISFSAFAVVAYVKQSIPPLIIGAIICGLFFNAHNFFAQTLRKRVRDEVENAFPKWLFDMCLQMQKNNVPNSISNSIETAPPILKLDLEKLVNEIREAPAEATPYHNFLAIYDLENVKEAMKRILALKEGTKRDQMSQMQNLIRLNMELIDERDAQQQSNEKAFLNIYCLVPMLPATLLTLVYGFCIMVKGYEFLFSTLTF